MMIRAWLSAGLIFLAAACGKSGDSAAAPDAACAGLADDAIQVSDMWIRAAAAGQPAAAYFTLCNPGATTDALVGIETQAAAAAELHETTRSENGVRSMAPIDRIELAPHASVALAPGGKHVMLTGLSEALAEGDSLVLTLKFKNGPPITLAAPVRATGAAHDAH